MHERKRGNKRTAQERVKHSCPRLGVCTLLGIPFMHVAHPQPILRHPHPSRLLSAPPWTLSSRLKVHCPDPSQSDATCCSRHPLHPQGHRSHERQSLFNPTRLCLVHASVPCGPQSRAQAPSLTASLSPPHAPHEPPPTPASRFLSQRNGCCSQVLDLLITTHSSRCFFLCRAENFVWAQGVESREISLF